MPMPKPKDSESKKDFLDRCMGNPTMVEDYPDNDQRYAICNSLWDKKESKSNNGIEIRTFPAEIRADSSNKKINGVASVFNVLSDDLGGFKEIIDSYSFGNLIYENDVRALINHDSNLILGRNQRSKTLRLAEDSQGLKFEVDPPNTSYANDLLVSMERGDVDQCSFAFRVADAYWEVIDGMDVRHITKFAELIDVSVVMFPAFPQTSAQVFGKSINTPEQIYAEFRSTKPIEQDVVTDVIAEKDIEIEETEKRNKLEKEYRDREIDILSL